MVHKLFQIEKASVPAVNAQAAERYYFESEQTVLA